MTPSCTCWCVDGTGQSRQVIPFSSVVCPFAWAAKPIAAQEHCSGPAATGSSLSTRILEPPRIFHPHPRPGGKPSEENREKREGGVYRPCSAEPTQNSEVSPPWTAPKLAWVGFHPCGQTAWSAVPALKAGTFLYRPLPHRFFLTLLFRRKCYF